jgi:hypothetical protein
LLKVHAAPDDFFGEPNSGGALLAGAEASAKASPPTNPRSTEDSLRFRAQLRPTFAHRSRANHRNPNSDEKGAHRRKTPAPIRFDFAEAERVYGRPNSGEDAAKLDTRRRQHFFVIMEAFILQSSKSTKKEQKS